MLAMSFEDMCAKEKGMKNYVVPSTDVCIVEAESGICAASVIRPVESIAGNITISNQIGGDDIVFTTDDWNN